MEKETEKETVKIKTHKGRIITLTISKKTETHYIGVDKFGKATIVPIEDIYSMFPVTEGAKNEHT